MTDWSCAEIMGSKGYQIENVVGSFCQCYEINPTTFLMWQPLWLAVKAMCTTKWQKWHIDRGRVRWGVGGPKL